MNKQPTILVSALLFASGLAVASAQVTAFTYQGRLDHNGAPFNGVAEFQPTLWDAASGGSPVGTNLPAAVVVSVTNGLFVLPLDFGASPFAGGANRWLQMEVRTSIGPFTTFAPRQALTATPYATTASHLSTLLPAAQLSGTLPSALLSGTYDGAVSFNNATNRFTGAFTGNGGGLTALNAGELTSGTVADARLSSNVPLLNGNQTFTGQNTFNDLLTVAGDVQMAGGAPYHHLELSGGNSLGYLYGSWPALGDGIHLGYNYYADASGVPRIVHSDGGTSRISVGYGSITLATAGAGFGQPVNRLIVTQTGNVGIHTASPIYDLEVHGGCYSVYIETSQISVTGNAYKPGGGSWSVLSDERLKKNIRPLAGVLDRLLALRGVSFEYKEPGKIHELSGERMGLIAQEVEKVFPDWVGTGPDGYKRVTVRGLEALVVEGLRELREEKDRKIAELEQRLERLESALAAHANAGGGR